jgi:plastocyanin
VKCEPFQEALSAFADGELDPGAERAVRDHLDRCPDCRRRLQQIEALGRRVRVRTADPVPDLTSAVLAAAADRGPRRSRDRHGRGQRAGVRLRLAPVAVFLLVVGLGIGAGQLESRASHAVPRATGRALNAASCAGEVPAGQAPPNDCRPAAAVPTAQVALRGHALSHPSLIVPAGTTVEWINADLDAHHLVRRVAGGQTSTPLGPGEHDAVTYDIPGTYPYYCAIHPHMQGVVTVLR